MSINLKLLILAAVILSDLVALAVVAPQLIRRGQAFAVPIMAGSIAITTVAVAWVLFSVVD